MAVTQYNKYIWLVDTIRSAKKITRQEIDRRWEISHLNEQHESRFPERSFFRCIKNIRTLFDIKIGCTRSHNGGTYYIAESDLNSETKQWLLSQFAMSQSLNTSRELINKILYEPIPAGTEYLTTIVDGMRDQKMLKMAHLRFDSNEPPHVFLLAPLCLKVFKQRWYVLGITEEIDEQADKKDNEPRLYALDRVQHMELTEKSFTSPKGFNPQRYFSDFYGVFSGKQYKPEIIQARVEPIGAKFLRSLPLHHSQKELEPCVFEWYVAPTLDFIQQLRTFGSEMEILKPRSLREQFKEELEKMRRIYERNGVAH